MYHIFENFNTSNATSPHFEAHVSFVRNIRTVECGTVHDYPKTEQCRFVTQTESCHESTYLIDYMKFIFCITNSDYTIVNICSILMISIFCVYLFTILGTTADKFFVPALAVISNALGLSENLAGITLLAFGNGSPDIFTAVAHPEGDTEMMYAELIGAACFIIAVIGGSIIIIRPFKINGYNFMRDSLFFMIAVLFVSHAMEDMMIKIWEPIVFIMIYVVFLVVVIWEHFMVRKIARRTSNVDNGSDTVPELDIEVGNLFGQFIKSINPIDSDEWRDEKFVGRILSVIKAPGIVALLLLIPIVDYELPNHGWTKLLNIIHCFTLPQFFIFVTNLNATFYHVPLFIIVLAVSVVIAIAVHFTSSVTKPPKYHIVFACGSFIGSILIIYTCASEVVSILETLGVISGLSHSFLGLSVLAWGNSIGDLIANIALARKGYTQMGFAACLGGPMFNSLIGIGLTYMIKLSKPDVTVVFSREGAMGPNCTIFLFFILLTTFVAFLLTNFVARRSIGIYMVSLYFLFFLYCILGEFDSIHPFGTDHLDEGAFQF